MKDQLSAVDWSSLSQAFLSHNLQLAYDSRHGEYNLRDGPAHLVINMFYTSAAVFNFNDALHDGWEHRLLWFFQQEPITFPSRLLTPPFPEITFHGRNMSIPREELEILKYLYRDDWWMEKSPPGCDQG